MRLLKDLLSNLSRVGLIRSCERASGSMLRRLVWRCLAHFVNKRVIYNIYKQENYSGRLGFPVIRALFLSRLDWLV